MSEYLTCRDLFPFYGDCHGVLILLLRLLHPHCINRLVFYYMNLFFS